MIFFNSTVTVLEFLELKLFLNNSELIDTSRIGSHCSNTTVVLPVTTHHDVTIHAPVSPPTTRE